MIRIRMVRPLDGFKLKLEFSDGMVGTYDLSGHVAKTGPMVQPLKDPEFFARVFLEDGAPTWPNGYDLAPWALHKELEDAKLLTSGNANAAE
jgi:Protein of unknown function (DUF2442)